MKLLVDSIDGDVAYFECREPEALFFGEEEAVCQVWFQPNRTSLQLMHRAVCNVPAAEIERRLFPKRETFRPDRPDPLIEQESELELFNEAIRGNSEQLQAVKHILNGTSHPAPYIVFGPPGTGKTVVLVEAILQVWKLRQDSRILVCAPSNTAADHVAEGLLAAGVIPLTDVVRPVSLMWYTEKVPKEGGVRSKRGKAVSEAWKLKDIVPTDGGLQTVLGKRIVVVTLAYAGMLITRVGGSKTFFTDVFIDEAGQATEPEAIIPLSGLMNEDSRLVLAGDHKQLPPVVLSSVGKKYGLRKSLLERLMVDVVAGVYKEVMGKRDAAFVTQLLKNYRSRRELMRIYNRLFYRDKLQSCVDEVKYYLGCVHMKMGLPKYL